LENKLFDKATIVVVAFRSEKPCMSP